MISTRTAGAHAQHAARRSLPAGAADAQVPPVLPAADPPSDWATIVREQQGRVYRLALHLTGNQHDAEDLCADVFVRIFSSLHTFSSGNFDGWVTTITYNLWRDRWRRRQRAQIVPAGDELPERRAAGADEAWAAEHLDLDLRAALAGLPERYRLAVVLCDVHGLAYDDIAGLLGVKLGTVRSRIFRGRALLRADLAHRAEGARRRAAVGAGAERRTRSGRGTSSAPPAWPAPA